MEEIQLHPMLIHFPIALFVGALVMEIVSLLFKRDNLHQTAIHMCVLGVSLLPLVVWTGLEEAEELKIKHPVAVLHKNLALGTAGVSFISVLFLLFFFKRFTRYFRLVFIVFLILIVGFVVVTAYNGGRLVYEYGVGVEE